MSSPRPIRQAASPVRGRKPIHDGSKVESPIASRSSRTQQNSHLSSDDSDSDDQTTSRSPPKRETRRRTLSPSPKLDKERLFLGKDATDRPHSPTFSRASTYTRHVYQHESFERSQSPTRLRTAGTTFPKCATQSPPTPTANTNVLIWVIIAIVGVICSWPVIAGITGSADEEIVKKNCTGFDDLKINFSHQDPYLWKALKSGVEGVLNGRPPSPSVFLFLHQNDISTKTIIKQIVNAAAACFDQSPEAVSLASKDFESKVAQNDQGVLIERYREAVRSGGVLLIANLNKFPPESAKALHFICDNVNPITNNVVIFLTLEAFSDAGKPVEIAEKTLNSIWSSKIDKNTLSALITRVTDQVIKLYPE